MFLDIRIQDDHELMEFIINIQHIQLIRYDHAYDSIVINENENNENQLMFCFDDINKRHRVYYGFKSALEGNNVDLGDIGYIRQLIYSL